jgi:hypothetical protein
LNRGKATRGGENDVTEKSEDLVGELITRLESASEVIEDLKAVLDQVQVDFDVK